MEILALAVFSPENLPLLTGLAAIVGLMTFEAARRACHRMRGHQPGTRLDALHLRFHLDRIRRRWPPSK